MWRLLLLAGLLVGGTTAQQQQEQQSVPDALASESNPEPSKRSPLQASAVYGAQPQGQYILRQGDEIQELAPEYLGILQQYLEAQAQQQQQHQEHQQRLQQMPRQFSQSRIGALIERELARLAERPAAAPAPKHQSVQPLEIEQYHVETSPRRPQPQPQHHQPQLQQLYYPVEEVEAQPQPAPQPVHHHAAPAPQAPAQQEFRYHQSIPIQAVQSVQAIQYGYEDEAQVREQQQSPQAIVHAQAQAEAAALAFHKIAQASHYKHQGEALEQIRMTNEKHRQQSALEQIRQGEGVSEAGRQERVQPKDPEAAYKARLKAQATALVAEQRRAHEAAEYKAHADAILKLQAQQRAHLKAQEEAHHYALNFEKNQQRAQAQAQAIANAQALALYKAHQAARAKAQNEAKQAAKAQAEARKIDPKSAPVIQYLLPKNVPLPAPEVYLPKAAEALREAALAEKRLKKPHHAVKQLLIEEVEPQLLRRKPEEQPQQQITFLVDAGYYRKHQQQPLLRQNEYQGLEEVSPRPHYRQYHQQIEGEKLALLVPIEAHQSP